MARHLFITTAGLLLAAVCSNDLVVTLEGSTDDNQSVPLSQGECGNVHKENEENSRFLGRQIGTCGGVCVKAGDYHCGSDGRSYSSACSLENAIACGNIPGLRLQHLGKCSEPVKVGVVCERVHTQIGCENGQKMVITKAIWRGALKSQSTCEHSASTLPSHCYEGDVTSELLERRPHGKFESITECWDSSTTTDTCYGYVKELVVSFRCVDVDIAHLGGVVLGRDQGTPALDRMVMKNRWMMLEACQIICARSNFGPYKIFGINGEECWCASDKHYFGRHGEVSSTTKLTPYEGSPAGGDGNIDVYYIPDELVSKVHDCKDKNGDWSYREVTSTDGRMFDDMCDFKNAQFETEAQIKCRTAVGLDHNKVVNLTHVGAFNEEPWPPENMIPPFPVPSTALLTNSPTMGVSNGMHSARCADACATNRNHVNDFRLSRKIGLGLYAEHQGMSGCICGSGKDDHTRHGETEATAKCPSNPHEMCGGVWIYTVWTFYQERDAFLCQWESPYSQAACDIPDEVMHIQSATWGHFSHADNLCYTYTGNDCQVDVTDEVIQMFGQDSANAIEVFLESNTFGDDPCVGLRKHVKITFYCREPLQPETTHEPETTLQT
eukprot:GHVN01098845.1.p1 GENE.GHVN01098845.1~~GHVN01098845.1.p1  ORF type:complete len:609 (+),score=30.91 GHVN01098845.1:121-1947(+)